MKAPHPRRSNGIIGCFSACGKTIPDPVSLLFRSKQVSIGSFSLIRGVPIFSNSCFLRSNASIGTSAEGVSLLIRSKQALIGFVGRDDPARQSLLPARSRLRGDPIFLPVVPLPIETGFDRFFCKAVRHPSDLPTHAPEASPDADFLGAAASATGSAAPRHLLRLKQASIGFPKKPPLSKGV